MAKNLSTGPRDWLIGCCLNDLAIAPWQSAQRESSTYLTPGRTSLKGVLYVTLGSGISGSSSGVTGGEPCHGLRRTSNPAARSKSAPAAIHVPRRIRCPTPYLVTGVREASPSVRR